MRDYIAHGAGDHLLMPGRIPDGQRRGGDCQSALGRYHTHRKAVPSTDRAGDPPYRLEPARTGHGGPVGLLYDGQPLGPHEAVEQLRSAIPGRGPIDDWTWVLVRAVPHDDGLMRFDSLFEVTTYPCELLWGPGNAWDAVTWAEQDLPEGDTVGVPDRLFLVQYDHGRLYLPRRPEIDGLATTSNSTTATGHSAIASGGSALSLGLRLGDVPRRDVNDLRSVAVSVLGWGGGHRTGLKRGHAPRP